MIFSNKVLFNVYLVNDSGFRERRYTSDNFDRKGDRNLRKNMEGKKHWKLNDDGLGGGNFSK